MESARHSEPLSWLKDCVNLVTFQLSHSRCEVSHAELLGEALKKCRSIRKIVLNGTQFKLGDLKAAVVPALQECPLLQSLKLTSWKTLGLFRTITLSTNAPILAGLVRLDLSNTNLGAAILALALCTNLQVLEVAEMENRKCKFSEVFQGLPTSLRRLNVRNNSIKPEDLSEGQGLCTLRRCTALTDLDISHNPFGLHFLTTRILSPTLKKVAFDSISDQHLADDMHHLTSWMQTTSHLQSLCLGNNKVGDAACVELAKGLSSLQALQTLGVEGLGLTGNGLQILLESLHNPHLLTSLRVSKNRLERRGADELGKLLSCCSRLQLLDLAATEIDDGALLEGSLAAGLSACTSLTWLDLQENKVTSAAFGQLLESIEQCGSQLVFLELSGNCVGGTGARQLVEQLHCGNLRTLKIARMGFGDALTQEAATGGGLNQLLQRHCLLQHLDLEHNEMTDHEALIRCFEASEHPLDVRLQGNQFSSSGLFQISERRGPRLLDL